MSARGDFKNQGINWRKRVIVLRETPDNSEDEIASIQYWLRVSPTHVTIRRLYKPETPHVKEKVNKTKWKDKLRMDIYLLIQKHLMKTSIHTMIVVLTLWFLRRNQSGNPWEIRVISSLEIPKKSLTNPLTIFLTARPYTNSCWHTDKHTHLNTHTHTHWFSEQHNRRQALHSNFSILLNPQQTSNPMLHQ